ncbi:alpha/beta fold hydrolase [Mycolicibacterium vaccae]|uniref:alpha/beta fold hydrolase n=1 Tax=Mycolicibacterium vaccae TaxID=1810 RepID=UPI003CEBA745
MTGGADSRCIRQDALADLADVPAVSRWVRSAELRLHVLDYGGELPPVVILPGITSPAICMDFVARRLTDLVRPVVVDIRGRGLSDDGDGYDLDAYAEDTEAVIGGLGLDCPVLLGHSMGARIAALTAARAKVPTRGTVLVDPPTSGPGRDPYPTTLDMFLAQLAQARAGTTADEVAQSWPRWPRREQELRARWLASCSEESIVASHRGFETEDFFATWPAVPAPTVFVYGAQSLVVPEARVREAEQTNPHAELVEVPSAGHMVFWDNPDVAVEVVRGALSATLT